MSKEEITAIAVRLFAIALAIYGLNNLPGMIAYFDQEQIQGAVYAFTGIIVLILIIALLLWYFPVFIAAKIIPKSSQSNTATQWNREELLSTGIIIIGIYFLFYVVSDIIYWFYIWKYSISFEGTPIEMNTHQLASIFATVGELFIVIMILFGSKGIANFITKLRYAGVKQGE
ncbi:MAG: hypothetical protein ABW092_16205 [Candidatus Thiodiazotropha sp.]